MRTVVVEIVIWDDDEQVAEQVIAKVRKDPRVLSVEKIA